MPRYIEGATEGASVFSLIAQGFLMGLAYVAPIGMQNTFVITSAASMRLRRALALALIVSAVDISLLLACFFGVGAVLTAVPWLESAVHLIGGALVLFIGVSLVMPERKVQESGEGGVSEAPEKQTLASIWTAKRTGRLADIALTAIIVTWLNPQAILDGTAMLGAFRSMLGGTDALLFVCGACCASLTWFTTLSLGVSALGDRLSDGILRGINVVCGLIVAFYGLRLILSFFAN